MAKKNRNDITKSIETNIYNNNNKEILASMVRSVMDDVRDSYFNLIDDRLKSMLYEGNTTLEQHLATIIGNIPVSGTVFNIDIHSRPDPNNYDVEGIVSSASCQSLVGGNRSVLVINFDRDISTRKLILVASTYADNVATQSQIGMPIYRRIGGDRIHVAWREFAGQTQSINLEIIAL